MTVVIRVDGGPEIGYGHLIRSSALCEEIITAGQTVTVATATPESTRAIFPDTVALVDLPSRGDPTPFVEWLETTAADVVFTDAYPVDTAYQQAVRKRAPLAVLQDDAQHAVCADLFINGNLYAPDQNYEFVGNTPKTCLGTEYVLLRREIRDRAATEPPQRHEPKRTIVMMGGSDIGGLTPTAVRAFDGLDLRVDAIVGPGCSTAQEQAVRTAATETDSDVRVTRDPDDLVDRMLAADIGVSTASSATYEFLALGTPLVSIPVVDNQEPIAAALSQRDAAMVLQRGDGEDAFRSAITEYVRNTELRRRRCQRGFQLVDGGGTSRVAAAIRDISNQHT
jgi:spore coat polysaccharide biosynthesis predicted glycosyltransferase SpsG